MRREDISVVDGSNWRHHGGNEVTMNFVPCHGCHKAGIERQQQQTGSRVEFPPLASTGFRCSGERCENGELPKKTDDAPDKVTVSRSRTTSSLCQ